MAIKGFRKKGDRIHKPQKIGRENLAKLIAEKPMKIADIIHYIRLKATQREIAHHYLVNEDLVCQFCKESIGMTFLELRNQCQEDYNLRLRENQLSLAKKSSAMSVRLGELWLGQAETPTAGAKTEDLSDVILKVEIGVLKQE